MKRVGILGLARSGKTTVFEAVLLGAGAPSSSSPGREHLGVVSVPDARLERLAEAFRPRRPVHARIQFVDTPGPYGGGGRGVDRFASLRECDALAAVLGDFDAAADPARDLRALETEIALADLVVVEGRLERVEKELRVGRRDHEREQTVLRRCRESLEGGEPLRALRLEAEDDKLLRGFQLLSRKPLLAIHNRGEDPRPSPPAPDAGMEVVGLQGRLECEVLALPAGDRARFRAELGIVEDGLSLVVRACYRLLGLLTFFTIGDHEVRAWALGAGRTALEAAGEIHTDFARGFIRAEVIRWDRLLEAGDHSKARERGWLRLEGRDYVVEDGDCLEIRFQR